MGYLVDIWWTLCRRSAMKKVTEMWVSWPRDFALAFCTNLWCWRPGLVYVSLARDDASIYSGGTPHVLTHHVGMNDLKGIRSWAFEMRGSKITFSHWQGWPKTTWHLRWHVKCCLPYILGDVPVITILLSKTSSTFFLPPFPKQPFRVPDTHLLIDRILKCSDFCLLCTLGSQERIGGDQNLKQFSYTANSCNYLPRRLPEMWKYSWTLSLEINTQQYHGDSTAHIGELTSSYS